MFAAGTIPTIRDEDGRLYINLVDLTRHLLLTAHEMEGEVQENFSDDPLVRAQGIGMVDTLYTLVKTLAEIGIWEFGRDEIAKATDITDLVGDL